MRVTVDKVAEAGEVAPSEGVAARHTPIRALAVLCVEDNPHGRVLLNTILAELGHRADFVATGACAVEAVARGSYDVVAPTAYFLERQIKAGVFARLDKSKLPNLAHMWPEITRRLAQYDPDNLYGVNYMWGTTGIGYNLKKSRELLGGDGRIDSWDVVFKPEQLAKFKD